MFDNCFHYSRKPVTCLKKRNYENRLWHTYLKYKPHGFWVAFEYPDDDQWAGECEGSWYHICMTGKGMKSRIRYKHRVTIAKDANLLIITNEKELDHFSDKYGFWKQRVPHHPLQKIEDKKFRMEKIFHPLAEMFRLKQIIDERLIDWMFVYAEYDGIIINPWIERRKFSYMWYEGWQCPSGCIWGLKAIDKVELINE